MHTDSLARLAGHLRTFGLRTNLTDHRLHVTYPLDGRLSEEITVVDSRYVASFGQEIGEEGREPECARRIARILGAGPPDSDPPPEPCDRPPEPLPLEFPACACPRHRTAAVVPRPPTVHAVRAEAGWFLEQQSLPRHQTVAGFGRDFAACIAELIPRVERAAREQGRAETVSAVVADARRRLGVSRQPGLVGEVTRVKGLAQCVVALGEYYDVLVQEART